MFYYSIVNNFVTFDKSLFGMMQFNNPEILYLLFLLIIPILIHLFQLQRFEKVLFTNVKLLKQIEQQTRKSSKLKKILILISRLLLFTCLIVAFAQPFSSKNDGPIKSETLIYLDNSLSMQAKGKQGELLQKSKHDLIESLRNSEKSISLITNNEVYKNLQVENLKNELLKIEYHPIKIDFKAVLLQIKNLRSKDQNTQSNAILISDFQNINSDFQSVKLDSLINYFFIQTLPAKAENVIIDSLWISQQNNETIQITSRVISQESDIENLSVSLNLNEDLYGKTTISLKKNEQKEIEFSFPNSDLLHGKLSFNDNLLMFDNNFYFNINPLEKSNVLSIGDYHGFVSKIYPDDEFNFTTTRLNNLDYSLLSNQNLVILNELESFPKTLIQLLKEYLNKNGNLVLIPSGNTDVESYNLLLSALGVGKIFNAHKLKKIITTINYEHPFFKDVFHKAEGNFQYPIVNMSYPSSFNSASSLLQFNDQNDFISEIKINNHNFYWVASPLSLDNSNFISSPLVVPVFYNFGIQNEMKKTLYYTIGNKNEIVLKTHNNSDEVWHISNKNSDFIPLQTKSLNKVKIEIENNPLIDGVYQISNASTEKYLAFNYNREESDMVYFNVEQAIKKYNNTVYFSSIDDSITTINDQYKKHNLWQLFVIFALIFLGIEILLQKFMKFNP